MAQDYPEYLALYDGYSYGIQRADVMRLFFLHKYGGIYIDLDIECKRSLDFLRHYPWVMPQVRAWLLVLSSLDCATCSAPSAVLPAAEHGAIQSLSWRPVCFKFTVGCDILAQLETRPIFPAHCWRSSAFIRHFLDLHIPAAAQTKPVGFSNDFMVAAPQHPFLGQMLAALPSWNRRFGTKYPTVMFSTGPMFVSYQVPRPQALCMQHLPEAMLSSKTRLCHTLSAPVVRKAHRTMHTCPFFRIYRRPLCCACSTYSDITETASLIIVVDPVPVLLAQASRYQDKRQLFVLPECLYGKYVTCNDSLFIHYVGSTWHANDAALLKNIFRHRLQIAMAALVAALAVAVVLYGRSDRGTQTQAAALVKGH